MHYFVDREEFKAIHSFLLVIFFLFFAIDALSKAVPEVAENLLQGYYITSTSLGGDRLDFVFFLNALGSIQVIVCYVLLVAFFLNSIFQNFRLLFLRKTSSSSITSKPSFVGFPTDFATVYDWKVSETGFVPVFKHISSSVSSQQSSGDNHSYRAFWVWFDEYRLARMEPQHIVFTLTFSRPCHYREGGEVLGTVLVKCFLQIAQQTILGHIFLLGPKVTLNYALCWLLVIYLLRSSIIRGFICLSSTKLQLMEKIDSLFRNSYIGGFISKIDFNWIDVFNFLTQKLPLIELGYIW